MNFIQDQFIKYRMTNHQGYAETFLLDIIYRTEHDTQLMTTSLQTWYLQPLESFEIEIEYPRHEKQNKIKQ